MTEAKQSAWRGRRLLVTVGALAALQVVAVALYLWVEGSRSESSRFRYEVLSTPQSLSNFKLEGWDGQRLDERTHAGRAVLMHFWATWCPPCRTELPALLELGRAMPEVEVIAVALDKDRKSVEKFFGGHVPREVVRDSSGAVAARCGVGVLPDTYLVDASGSVRIRFGGARDWSRAAARRTLAELIVE